MPISRFVFIVPFALLLAACGGDTPKPPATPTATAKPAPTVAAPAPAPKPAAPVVQATAEAIAPLIGSWAADLGNCGGQGMISISATEFRGTENVCAITSMGDNGDGTFMAAMDCTAEGAKTSERIAMNPIFAPSGEGITLTYLDRGNEEVTVLRCPAPRAAATQ